MMNLKKGSALLLVGMMIMSGLVAFLSAPVVSADTIVGSSRFDVVFDDTFMTDELIYDVDNADMSYFFLGEGDGVQDDQATANTLGIQIQCVNDWYATGDTNATNVNVNITNYNSNVFDFEDPDPSTSDINGGVWPAPGIATFAGDLAGVTTMTFTWTFDVLKTAGLGAASDTSIDLRIWYRVAPAGRTSTFDVQIYLSSIFDDPTTPGHEHLPDMLDANTGAGEDVLFEAGDTFEPARLELWNYDSTDIDDLECIVTPPTANGITLRNNRAWLPNGINPGQSDNATYRVDVASRTLPGVYPGTAAITYTRDDSDLRIVEPVTNVVDFRVNYNFYNANPYPVFDTESREQCYASAVTLLEDDGVAVRQEFPVYQSVQIDQSTFSDKTIKIEVNITNNGNVDLQRVTYMLDVTNPLWDYFRNPKIYYDENSGPIVLYDDISIMFNEHNIGTVISFNFTVIVAKEIPIGEHRLPILYDGFFFDNGTLGDPTNMTTIMGGNGLPSFPTPADPDDLELSFSVWVNDGVMDCYSTGITAGPAADKLDIRSEEITVGIVNMEGYSFIDILVTANFTGTPYYAPLIDTATGQPPVPSARSQIVEATNANVATPLMSWGWYNDTALPAYYTIEPTFRVDTDSTMRPDRYPFTLTITAIIENTLEEVTTTIAAGAEFDFVGYGAVPLITAFTAEDIIPGQAFDLVLTVENVGDDTLRDVWLDIAPDNTAPFPWDIESDFKLQFDWAAIYSNWVDVTGPIELQEDMFYTMESLDVDNIREIIEINLYMEGVYSDPGSTIQLIHIIDLAPGASFDVTFEMFADKDMVNGKPYNVIVRMTGIDPDDNAVNQTQILEVWSSLPGDSYNPVELDWFDAGLKLLFLVLFFLIVLALLLLVYNKFKGEPSDEDEDEFDFEDDDEPASFEEPKAPETETKAPEELVQP